MSEVIETTMFGTDKIVEKILTQSYYSEILALVDSSINAKSGKFISLLKLANITENF